MTSNKTVGLSVRTALGFFKNGKERIGVFVEWDESEASAFLLWYAPVCLGEYFSKRTNGKETAMNTEEINKAEKREEIEAMGSVTTQKDGFRLYCLSIIGQVEGHSSLDPQIKSTKYEHVLPELVAVEENPDIDGMLVLLNTVGGDVEAGLAMAEMIAGMEKPVVSLVLGGGHSIGVPLAVAAKRSFITPSATMTLHPVRFNGLVVGASQSFDYLERMQDRISRFIISHSSVKEEVLRDLMYRTDELACDMGSVLDGERAVEVGLIDALGGLSHAIATLKQMKKEKKKRS